VIHHVFSLLSPRDLALLRLTSHSMLSAATANTHWRRHFFDNLLPSYAALADISSITHSQWAFQLVPDGWFRAYTTIIRIAREDWLRTDEELKGSTWMVFFKSYLREGGASSDDAAAHALVELKHDRTSVPIEGLPLRGSSWYVDQNKSLRCSYHLRSLHFFTTSLPSSRKRGVFFIGSGGSGEREAYLLFPPG